MAKTAEEIAKKWAFPADSDAIEAMQEFAAQEVEAYKERLKAYLKDYYSGTEIDLSHIIDAVK